jgi:hypothetical protein
MTEESIPELLARIERKHSEVIFYGGGHSGRCCCGVVWPCDIARLVAHIRSLEAVAAKGRNLLACNHEERPLRNAMPICFACYNALTAAMVAIDTILAPRYHPRHHPDICPECHAEYARTHFRDDGRAASGEAQ